MVIFVVLSPVHQEPSSAPGSLQRTLEERRAMYKTALENAKAAGESSRVRRYDRGLKVGRVQPPSSFRAALATTLNSPFRVDSWKIQVSKGFNRRGRCKDACRNPFNLFIFLYILYYLFDLAYQ